MNIRPTGVTLNKTEGYLEISWSDDRVCQYPLSHLREACPCVECRGGHENMGMEHAPDNLLELKPARDYTMNELNPVGIMLSNPSGTMGMIQASIPGNTCAIYARNLHRLTSSYSSRYMQNNKKARSQRSRLF